jgi:hypothetical protein
MKTTFAILILVSACLSSFSFGQVPQFNSDEEKQEWIKNNENAYQEQLNKKSTQNQSAGHSDQVIDTVGRTPVQLNGFPQYVNTGNLQVDSETYQKQKVQWINNNPQEYKDLTKDAVVVGEQKIVIYKDVYDKMTDERKLIIDGNRHKYFVSSELDPVQNRSDIQVSNKIQITRDEFIQMPLDRQKRVLNDLDKYEIVGSETQIALIVIKKEDMNSLTEEVRNKIELNPDLYIIVE